MTHLDMFRLMTKHASHDGDQGLGLLQDQVGPCVCLPRVWTVSVLLDLGTGTQLQVTRGYCICAGLGTAMLVQHVDALRVTLKATVAFQSHKLCTTVLPVWLTTCSCTKLADGASMWV